MNIMLNVLTGLYSWGTSIDTILIQWEQIGVFRYALPFLLIFAVVFGILQKSGILGEDTKGVNVVVAMAIALLALQFEYIPAFFATIFPYAGIGIAILLVFLILTGLFHSDKDWWGKIFLGIGLFIAVIVVLVSLASYQWMGGWWWYQYWPAIITLTIIVGLMVLVILATKGKKTTPG